MALALKLVFACARRTNIFGFGCVVTFVLVFVVNSNVGIVVSDDVVVDEGVSVAVDVPVSVVIEFSVRKIASNKPNLAVAVLVVEVPVKVVVDEGIFPVSNVANAPAVPIVEDAFSDPIFVSLFFLLLFLRPGIPV